MLTEFASQKRVYEVVAKPVVEVNSVLKLLLALEIYVLWLHRTHTQEIISSKDIVFCQGNLQSKNISLLKIALTFFYIYYYYYKS